jgi:hypothetical protein
MKLEEKEKRLAERKINKDKRIFNRRERGETEKE